jgi:hypothetical protein
MEALALALLIVRNAYRRQETVVPEPDEFQPFDVQALRHSYYSEENGPSRPFPWSHPNSLPYSSICVRVTGCCIDS